MSADTLPPLKSDLMRVLVDRGYYYQTTDAAALDKTLSEGIVPAYIGFDATADSLHVGNLLQIMMLRWLQKCGHKPVVLMGGGTTRIGDPTGRDDMRKVLTDEAIGANIAGIRKAFDRFLTFGDGPTDAVLVNNASWLDSLGYIQLLREVGHHFSVNRMLTMDSVRMRLEREQPMSFLEFNYMILQGYDFMHMHREMGVRLQLGGSDQWGNILAGVELTRRIAAEQALGRGEQEPPASAQVFGFTAPLISTASGQKMGKSQAGAVWLNADKRSPYEYWQFWRNTEDADVGRFLRLFTELPLDEIRRLESLPGAEINEAKKVLANEATALAHGQDASVQASETARAAFETGTVAAGLPEVDVAAGTTVVDALIGAGLADSKNAARKLIQGSGVRLDDEKVADIAATVPANERGFTVLSKGKQKVLLRLAASA